MRLNCKPGDLAVVVRSYCKNEGRILTCVRLAAADELASRGHFDWMLEPVWVTDSELRCSDGGTTRFYPDGRLRPLRDSEGEDEVLRMVGRPLVPKREEAT